MSLRLSKNLVTFLIQDLSSFGEITSISLFGGFGLRHDGVIFGRVYQDNFYVRGHAECLDSFLALDMKPFTELSHVTPKSLQYYKIPETLYQNHDTFLSIVELAIFYSKKDEENKRKLKESRLKEYANITLSLERSLFYVGIPNIETLRFVGCFAAFYRLTQKNSKITAQVLYTLYSALKGRHVATLTTAEKAQVWQDYENYLLSIHSDNS